MEIILSELNFDQIDIGVQARLMSQALRKISPSLTKSKCVLIFINQIRMKIGVMFGNPETTTGMLERRSVLCLSTTTYLFLGGNALKFYSSVRLDIRSSFILLALLPLPISLFSSYLFDEHYRLDVLDL